MVGIFRRQVPSGLETLMATDKMIVMGAQADPELLRAEANAHHTAIDSISGPNSMTAETDWDGANVTLGRVSGSEPIDGHESHKSVSSITISGVPAYLDFLVNGTDAEMAYAGFLEFKVASTDTNLWPFKVESGQGH